ncbi:MAG: rRNA maturation RNase YbeY [Bacteroidia bacterium]
MSSIQFFNQETNYLLKNKNPLRNWLLKVAKAEGRAIDELNYIFCNDAFLYQMNVIYLNHHSLTDVITFDNSMAREKITGDIFISIERVKENAKTYNVTVKNELERVMVHGLLHLCGYKDKTPKEKKLMTEKENFYLKRIESRKKE